MSNGERVPMSWTGGKGGNMPNFWETDGEVKSQLPRSTTGPIRAALPQAILGGEQMALEGIYCPQPIKQNIIPLRYVNSGENALALSNEDLQKYWTKMLPKYRITFRERAFAYLRDLRNATGKLYVPTELRKYDSSMPRKATTPRETSIYRKNLLAILQVEGFKGKMLGGLEDVVVNNAMASDAVQLNFGFEPYQPFLEMSSDEERMQRWSFAKKY